MKITKLQITSRHWQSEPLILLYLLLITYVASSSLVVVWSAYEGCCPHDSMGWNSHYDMLECQSSHSIEGVWSAEKLANGTIQESPTVSTQLSHQEQIDLLWDEAWGSDAKYRCSPDWRAHHRNGGLEAQRPRDEQLGQTLLISASGKGFEIIVSVATQERRQFPEKDCKLLLPWA